MEERIEELEKRIDHLERELGESYERYKFEQRIARLVRTRDVDAEIRDSKHMMGYHAKLSDLSADELNEAIDRLIAIDDEYDWAMTETSEGIGLEVWTV